MYAHHCTAGECYDEMNRAVWVVALNAIMQTTAAANGSFSFAAGAFDHLSPAIHDSDVRHSLLTGSSMPAYCKGVG